MLILLSGWKNSGKDTTADLLVKRYGFIKLAFASALKDLVSEQYGIPRHYFDDRERKEQPLPQFPVHLKDGFSENVNTYMRGEFKEKDGVTYHTPRSLCILEGSIKRSVDPNFWVKRAVRGLDPRKSYVISDWRYRTEYEALKHLSPITVRVQRFETALSTDPSERDLDKFPFHTVLKNTGAITDLNVLLAELLSKEAA